MVSGGVDEGGLPKRKSPVQSFFGLNFGGNADVDIVLDGQDERRMAEIKDENGRKERHYLYYDGESVTGKVRQPISHISRY